MSNKFGKKTKAVVFWAAFLLGSSLVTSSDVLAHGDDDLKRTHPSKGLIYIAMGPSNNVAVLDAATGTVIDTLAGVYNSHGVAITPDGKFLVATSRPLKKKSATRKRSTTVRIFDTTSGDVIAEVDVGGGSHHASMSPDGRTAYVTVASRGGVALIDVPGRRLRDFIVTGEGANAALPSPDGRTLFVTNRSEDTLSIVDLETLKIKAKVDVGRGPDHLATTPDGKWVITTNGYSNDVSILEVQNSKVLTTIKTGKGPHGLAVTADGGRLFVSNRGAKSVNIIDLRTRKVIRTIPLGKGPGHMALGPDGSYIIVNDEGGGRVFFLDPKTGKRIRTISVWPEPHEIAVFGPPKKKFALR